METFDVVVLGAGPGGEVAAGRLGEAGLSVAIVEDRKVGGECSFWACMPSKALLRPGEALAEARRIPGAAEAASGELDVSAVLRRRDEVIHDLDDASQLPWLEQRGVALFRGWGRIDGERRVAVGDVTLEARRAVILAGGTAPAIPPIDGLADAEPWTNREATTAKQLPARLVIMGGGVVGVEMAQAYASLGVRVSLIEGERRLLPREEEFACKEVTDALAETGVDIRTGQKACGVRRQGGEVHVALVDGSTVTGDELLVAVGRAPQVDGLGLETVGLDATGYVEADLYGRVPGVDWLYAIGDVNGRAQFTHMAKYQARVTADHLLGRDTAEEHLADGPLAPRVIFTDPQVAAVGHTTKTAKRAGLRPRVVDAPTSGNAGGSFYGRGARGTSRFLLDEERGVLVGATITGSEVADFLHAATIAVVAEVPIARLRHAVPAFPTRSEIWLKLLEAVDRAAAGVTAVAAGTEVAVVGAGIVGLFTAAELAERGVPVTVYERALPGGAQSGGDSRIFRHGHDDVRLVALAQRSHALWRTWEERLGVELLAADGVVALGERVRERLAVFERAGGVRARRVGATELAERLPMLAPWEGPALLDEDGGVIRTREAVAGLAGRLGAAIVAEEVIAVRATPRGAVELRTAGTVAEHARVVVCAGRDTPRLAAGVGLALPVRHTAHVRLTYAVRGRAPERVACLLDGSGAFGEPGAYGDPLPGNDRYAIGLHDVPARADGSLLDAADLAHAAERTTAYVARALPGLEPRPVGVRHCWVTDLPWSHDAMAAWEAGPLTFFAGNNLFKHAPAVGRALAEACAGAPLGDLRPEARLGDPEPA